MAAATIELPFISSHYAIAESTLSTLTTAPTVELVNQLLEAITTKAREHDELKSDKIRLEVELDNAVRSRDNKIKVLKSSVEKGHAEVEETRKKLHESENIRSTLESEIATLKSSSTSNESEASSLKSRISSLEASNRDTLSLLESKSAAYDKLAEELSTQHKKTIELRRELSTAEQNLQAANSASASAKFREQSLQQDLELTKKNNEWFETELKTKSAEYLKFRKEKSARISELQRENEEISANVDSLRRSENALKSRLDEVEQRYEEALSSINQLREDAIKATESFRIELDSASRLAELQSNAAETSKQRAKECQLALDKAREDAAEQISRLRVEIETEHADKEAAERRVAELELTVSQLESDGFAGRRSMSPALNGAGPSTPMRPSTPVGAFSPRASRGKGGLTLTQMYTEYDKMRTSLAMEQKTNQELRSTLDEMVQDLEASKPEIDELRADHGRLENAVVEMSNILETAGKERDDATKEARKWQGQVEGLAREGDILRQQLRDLSAQIKVLVLENAILKEGETTYDREELEKIARQEIDDSSADLNPTGRFISRNLMTFKDLHELQEQNVTLRRMLRELGDKMEGAEAREQDAIRQQEQEELKELRIRVQTYRDEIANLVAQTKSYVKERDTFRSMLTRRRQTVGDASVFSQSLPLGAAPPASEEPAKDVPDYADLLRKVQAHFDSFREESATDHAALKQQVNELSRKNSELMSEISRSSSQLVAATQRAELLQGNFDMLKNENAEMQKRYATLLENANRQDIRTQQAAEDLVETKGLVESLQRENANLKAEKDLWKNIEKRLIEDNETLRNERGRLDSLNANLQTILNEREHTDAESRRRLQSSVESLESELQSTKRKLNDEVEEGKKASLRREYEHEQSQKRIDDLVTSLGAAREELVAAKTTRDHLQSRVDELTVELRSAEERLQVVQTKPSVSAAPTEAPAVPEEGQESGLTREQELGIEVSELRRDLGLTKNELQHAEERVEDYKAISQQSEERLQSVTETQEQYREETERLIEEKDKKIQDLEKRIEEISTELSTTNGELTKLRDEQGEAGRHLEEQKAALEAEITRLKDENERQIASAQFHQEDLKAQAEIAQHAQQNYESELVKHAEAAKNLQLVRSEANQLKLEVVELRTQADTFKKDLAQKEESWTEIKDRYESELTELQKRREEVLHQNSLLHTQLENITNQIAALQRDRANIPEGDEDGEAGAPNLEGLQEVIKFLRREKEIVDVQYHLSTQESKRLRQQLDYTQTQLDEARLKLEQQRRAAADSEHSALSHNKLMETLNELNLFRESSVTLRNQVKQAETSLAEKSSRIEELVQQIQPLETRIRELENTVETKDGELKLLQDDRDRWQQRTQNILQKYDRVDPAEMEGLKEKLETLEKERDEAVAARDTLQTQAAAFPEQLKHAEDRVQELRTKLTDQFKARSKELTGRINAKQVELNTVVQEKEVIQEELKTTREELNELKARMAEKPAAPAPAAVEGATGVDSTPASQFPAPTTQPPAASDDQRVKALEEKVQRLEAALAEKETALAAKETEHEAKIKERSDKLKEMFNSKLAEVRAAHRQEVERLKSSQPAAPQEPGTPAPKSEQVPATPATPAAAPATPSKDTGLPELTDAQARELVAKNETIRNIIRSNIRTQVAKQKETDKQESQANQEAMSTLEQKFNEEREALKKAHEEGVEEKIKAAVELSDKKSLAKLSMLDTRYRTAQAKIDVVQKAATETPQKPVVEVWEVAKTTRAPPAAQAKPAQVASPAPAPSPAPAAAQATPVVPSPSPAPTATPAPTPAATPAAAPQAQPAESAAASTAEPPSAESTPQTGAPAQQQPQQQPAPEQAAQQQAAPATAQPATNAPPNPFGQSQNKQPTSLPSKPPAGNAPGLMRALTSGLPVARGGRTGGRGGSQANPFGQQQGQQQQAQGQGQAQQQAPSQRGSGLPRGRGGRGGHGRGGNQNVQATNAAQQGQASPGRSLNAGARQFVPQGNKRAREDGGEAGGEGGTTGGKRMRGGGHTRGS